MKLKFSILSILAAGVLFSSCEPRDTKITRPDTRVNPTGGPAGSPTDGKADNYKYIAVLADRQVEAIELFRAVTDEQFAAAKNITLEDVEIEGSKYKKISAKSTLKSEKLETTRDTALLAQLVVDENGKLQQIVAKESQAQLTFEKAVKLANNTDISVKNKLKSLVMTNLGNDSWRVSLTSSDEINLKIGKSIMMNVLKFTFTPTDAVADTFNVKDVEMVHMRSGALVGDFSMKSDAATTMVVAAKTAEKCTSVSGVLHLNSFETKKNKDNSLSPLYDRTLAYENSDVVVTAGKDKFPLPAAECENRLSVDLGKLLN